MAEPRKAGLLAFLCRIGIHRWRFAGINLIPTGAHVRCSRCGKEAYQSWI